MRTIAFTLTLAAFPLQTPPASGPYRITHTYTLGGDGGWDYIVPDSANHRVFIGRTDRVMVVDENSGTLVGTVTGIKGAHGTAIAPKAGRGFATSGNDASVVMFDLKSFQTLEDSGGGRRGRDHLRPVVQSRVHLQRRRAFSTVIDPQAGARRDRGSGGSRRWASAGDGRSTQI